MSDFESNLLKCYSSRWAPNLLKSATRPLAPSNVLKCVPTGGDPQKGLHFTKRSSLHGRIRFAKVEALHASRCDLYFHWNASLARPRIVGRKGSPVRLQAHLLPVDRRGVELIAKLEGSNQRLLGLVAESKELAVQGLVEWIECADELDVEAPSPCISSSSDSSRSSG